MVTTFIMFTAPLMILWAQEMNEKYSMTTQMFLQEQKEKSAKPVVRPRQAPKFKLSDKVEKQKARRLIASPDTVAGVAYISCFIHLKNVNNLSEVQSLGVEIEETFDGLNFITARVPVKQLKVLADIDNVTHIKVAEQIQLMTDVAKRNTNVDDILTLSPDAVAQGITNKYDGTGVVLGIIDGGIDFQHAAFKDKNGNSRIKWAYVDYGSGGTEYTTITGSSPTTDDNTHDHGTHTASTAGGSSVIVNGSTVTVTDNHANATYGGMAPGADLYLAGVDLNTGATNALKKMVAYADAQGKPIVVSNSWGIGWGPRDGTGELADLVGQYFGDSHPNHIILFASSNDGMSASKDNEGGGYFVKKSSASSSSPLGTIMRTSYVSDGDAGCYYADIISTAWSSKLLNCRLYVLDNSTGAVKASWVVSSPTTSFDGLNDYYDGTLTVDMGWYSNSKFCLLVSTDNDGLWSKSATATTKNGETYYKSDYTLAIEVYPANGSANIDMWAGTGSGSGSYSYFTNHLSTNGHIWMAGTSDMCVSDNATIPNAISVGAYVSKTSWNNFENSTYGYTVSNALGDIASFSSYATAENSPTGLAYPWITAPGAMVVAGVNHYHTTSVNSNSYFNSKAKLIVNNSSSPYAVMEGTSMATPVAAGIVALWLQAAQTVGKDLTVNDVKEIMEQTAINDIYTSGTNASHFGKGKIDALAGIKYIQQNAPEKENEDEYTDISSLENAIYITKLYGHTGTTINLNIKMKNNITVKGCSFKLELPEDFELVTDDSGNVVYELSDWAKAMSVIVNQGEDNSYYFSLSTLSGAYTGTDDTVITLKIVVPNDADGNYKLYITEALFIGEEMNNYPLEDVVTALYVPMYPLGDVNHSGTVTPADALMIQYDGFGVAQKGFYRQEADLIDDGHITSDDTKEALFIYFREKKSKVTKSITKQ